MQVEANLSIAVFGDINVDLSFSIPTLPREGDDIPATALGWNSGGAGLNAAIAFARLGGRVRLIGRIGRDPAAEVALRAARTNQLDCSAVQIDNEIPTGLCGVIVSPNGQRTFLSYRGANVHCAPADLGSDLLAGCALLFIGGHTLLDDPQRASALRLIDLAKAKGIPIALDLCLPAIHRVYRIIEPLLPQIWLLTLNEDELQAMLPGHNIRQGLERLHAYGVCYVGVKRGAQGCSVGRDNAQLDILPPAVSAVDTNACGDAFAAGFAWALLHGADLRASATLANLLGALTATRAGAAEAIPERAAIVSRLDSSLHYLLAPPVAVLGQAPTTA